MDSILSSRREAGRLRRAPGGAACEPSVGPHSPGADLPAELVAKAILIRQTERRLLKLFAEGLLAGTVHTCLGQEWIGVAVAAALRPGDQLFSNHRCHGHYLAWTDDVEGLVAELAGRATGVCGGRGGSQHLCKDGFYSNGIQGGIVPVATGLAMAAKLRTTGGIAAVFIGDGTFGEGAVYEAMNIASLWSLPLLMVVEDNGIAQSTPRDPAMAGGIPERAAAFAIECRAASTAEPAGLLRAAAQAANDVRHEGRPILLHVATARLHAHSKGDDTRSPEELAVLAAADPLNRLIGTEPAWTAPMIATAEERLDRAVELAVASP